MRKYMQRHIYTIAAMSMLCWLFGLIWNVMIVGGLRDIFAFLIVGFLVGAVVYYYAS